MPIGRYVGIDLLRVAAGFTLLVAHSAFWLAPLHWPDTLWLALAYLGVEAFLVSLGFLLALQWLGEPAQPLWPGIGRRLLRLWPLYAVAVLLNLYFVDLLRVPAPSLLEFLGLVQNLAWPHPEFFPEAWIVPAAFAASIVAALACAGLRRCRSTRGAVILVVAMILLAHVPRIVAVASADSSWDIGVRKIVSMRLDAALYGVLLAILWQRGSLERRLRVPMLAAAGGIVLLIAMAIFMASDLDHSGFARIGLFTMTDLGFALMLPWLCRLRTGRLAAGIAATLASCAYVGLLGHMSLLRLGYALGVPITAATIGGGLVLLVAYLVVATLVAWLSWRWLDRPLRRLLRISPPQHAQPIAER